jgi:membrane-bound metal-dependent hydrolase YbcI (DUF457 family)
MTGTGHRLTGIGAAFIAAGIMRLLGGSEAQQVIAWFVAMGTTRIPDTIEFPTYNNGFKTGCLIPHRTITHWPYLWVALAWYCYTLGGYPSAAGLGLAIGALSHILWDAPNPMGIPWVLPHKRISFGRKGLWRSGRGDYLIAAFYGAVGFWFWTLTDGWVK